jgi:hypothetical protein
MAVNTSSIDFMNTDAMGKLVASGMQDAAFWIILLLAIAFFMGIVFFIWWYNSFKIRVRIKEVINNSNRIIDTKCKEWYDDKQVLWWVRRDSQKREKKYIPIPPELCVDSDYKGIIHASFFYKDGKYTPIDGRYKGEGLDLQKDQPLTTTQRTLLVNNVRSAEQRRGKSLLEQLPTLVSIGALVLIVICLLVFYGNIAQPVIEARQLSVDNQRINLEVVQELRALKGDIQLLKNNDNVVSKPIAPN